MSVAKPTKPTTLNAVIVLPGIMGSELEDETGTLVWGLNPRLWARDWLTDALPKLRPTEEELAGKPRLRPTRLLRAPAWLPVLRGLEPYTEMLRRAQAAAHPDHPGAVAEFPYDWRMPINHNAKLLVRFATRHLENWRAVVKRENLGDKTESRLVIIAHSMGGLIARYACRVLELDAELADVITLGTPFFGSLNALETMASGTARVLLPRDPVRELVLGCPGVYDLLPRYRCVADGAGIRSLTVDDVTAIGGCRKFAVDAAARWEELELTHPDPKGSVWRNMCAILGWRQPTWQSVVIDAGSCQFLASLDGKDESGDSTVYEGAASPMPASPREINTVAVAQKHGALMRDEAALTQVEHRLVGTITGPPMGAGEIGADIPDLIPAGTPPVIAVTATDGEPGHAHVSSTELSTGQFTRWHFLRREGDRALFIGRVLPAGLHRVEAHGGTASPVSDLMMVSEDKP
ncbi:MAG: hypothetical protein FWD74_12400 [Actinomycetia bacterium]|nr:hypothetical protein [Actinomycetes bacterium]